MTLDEAFRQFAATIKAMVKSEIKAATDRLQAVEKRLDDLPAPKAGEPGRDGADGRDALQLDIAAGIDPERDYHRGAWAQHKGGLWRCKGGREWECMVRGVAETSMALTGARELTLTSVMSDGTEVKTAFALPIPIYKGIYRPGDIYEEGDMVTSGGSVFHAKRQTDSAPETGDDWKLAVKRGRDGRNLK